MNCEILETLYVRGNGDIPCDCSLGEKVLLGTVDHRDPAWDVHRVLTNEKYAHIRATLSAGELPWGAICEGCAWLRRNERFTDDLRGKWIRKLQVEPSLACNLDCPCCSSKTQRRTRAKPFLMELETFDALLRSLRASSYFVAEIEYCGQGDPLMHPRFADFVRTARARYPGARQHVVTNGNFSYGKAIGDVFVDHVIVSCDGVFPESYGKYRIGGDVAQVIDFMKAIPKRVGGKRQRITWKYILFEFNDSEAELVAAQRLAQDIGVDTLMFVVTHSLFKSVTYRPETIGALPILFPNVTTSLTPSLLQPGGGVAFRSLVARLRTSFGRARRRLRAQVADVIADRPPRGGLLWPLRPGAGDGPVGSTVGES